MRKIRHLLIMFVLSAIFLIQLSSATISQPITSQSASKVFFVSSNGSDTNDGSVRRPWATVNHAAQVLEAGETVYIRAGTYALTHQIQAKHSGTETAWITYRAFPGERVILDAVGISVAPPSGEPPFAHDQGAFQLENVEYIQVKNIEIVNSHNSGITVRNSRYISLYNNRIENTFSPAIGVWKSQHQTVIGNIAINANAREMAGFPNDFSEMPHEAISLGSVENFEVAYNLVQDGQKEGIDIKEESKSGTVHHNYVHHMMRQGLYVDSWDGELDNIELYNNVVHDCRGAGFAISVEGGSIASNIRFHHNLIYDNWGTGIFFSTWGNDGLRQGIRISQNTVHHNGYGKPNPGDDFFWITGGLYLFSTNIQDLQIDQNIFSKNAGFQIGYSDRYWADSADIEDAFSQKNIAISQNLIFGTNSSNNPIYAGWAPDSYANIYATEGSMALVVQPPFIDAEGGNFYLQPALISSETDGSPPLRAIPSDVGAFPGDQKPDLWWQTNFPPQFTD